MNGGKSKGNGGLRFAFLAGIVLGGISLACKVIGLALVKTMTGGEAASVGVIGGADGPTAVFIASEAGALSVETKIALNLILVGICVFGYCKLSRKK